MCEELEECLEEGRAAARAVVYHLESMRAANLSIPVTTESGDYVVEARKTLSPKDK